MSPNGLKQKAVSGMVWTSLQKYSVIGIHFISGIILARLLTPYDYGCIGMLSIFMVLAETIIDGGFGSALIQKKQPSQIDYSTIFYWNLAMAVLMYLILFACAPMIARFYDIPMLSNVLRVQGVILFIYAFNIVQRNQLKKKLDFKILSIVSIVTSIVSLCITILMAYNGFGVWSLVVQNIVTTAIPSLVFWFYVKWRPQLLFSWQSFKDLFSFGLYMFLTHLVNGFSQHIQGLLIGKMFNASTMGYYSKAHSTEKMASTSISKVMTEVTYPLYASVQDDKKKIGNMIKGITMTLSYVTFPLMFLLLLCAKPLFVLLYSERWLQSVPYFQVLCISGLAFCLQSVNLQAISAIGKSKTMFVWTMIKRGVGISLVVFGLMFFGMRGLLIGVVLNSWVSYFVNIGLVSKHIGYSWKKQLRDITPVLLAAIVAFFASLGIGMALNLSLFLDGFIKIICFLVVYLGWSFIFKPNSFLYFVSIIQPLKSLIKQKKQ